MLRLTQILLTLLLATGTLYAQETRGTLNGLVVDDTGAAVPNAKVVVTNTATNQSRRRPRRRRARTLSRICCRGRTGLPSKRRGSSAWSGMVWTCECRTGLPLMSRSP